MNPSKKHPLQILGTGIGSAILLLILIFASTSVWRLLSDRGLVFAKHDFLMRSFEVEEKILKELGILASSEAVFVRSYAIRYVRGVGPVRRYPIYEVKIHLYAPEEVMNVWETEGGGKIDKSKSYQKVRSTVIAVFSDQFRSDFFISNAIQTMYAISVGRPHQSWPELIKLREDFKKRLSRNPA